MNEHIKRCILDAGFPKFDKMYVVSDGEELEKFAKLIVKECLSVVYDPDGTDYGSIHDIVYADIESRIKEHFGVEE